MKTPIFKYIPVFSLAILVFMMGNWANPLFFSDASMVSLAEAKEKEKDKEKDKDKDKDKDNDNEADCDPSVYVNQHIGICSNRGTVTVIGMKRYVNVSSGSGAVLADVTSKGVHLTSKSGDLTGRGLTGWGIFKSRIGNVRVKYCKKVNKNTGSLYVQIAANNPEGADADLQFTTNSKLKLLISGSPNRFKSDFTSKNNGLPVSGSVLHGSLFISEYNIADPACKY